MWAGGLGYAIMFNLRERKKHYMTKSVHHETDNGPAGT